MLSMNKWQLYIQFNLLQKKKIQFIHIGTSSSVGNGINLTSSNLQINPSHVQKHLYVFRYDQSKIVWDLATFLADKGVRLLRKSTIPSLYVKFLPLPCIVFVKLFLGHDSRERARTE